MSGQSLALASLTATYTDSEAEDEAGEEVNSPESSIHSNISTTPPPQVQVPRPPPPPAIVSSKVAQLVSYHDDTIVSDEEGGEGPTLRRSLGAEEVPPEVTMEDGVKLFTEPPGRCSNELQEKINRLHEKMLSSGLDMNHVIQQRKVCCLVQNKQSPCTNSDVGDVKICRSNFSNC